MRKEIGSEFWDIPTCKDENHIFPDNTKWFLSGRTALAFILQDIQISSVSMPHWCCSSMIEPFKKAGISVSFYEDVPDTTKDAILIMDYFGYTGHSQAPNDYKGIVIRDITHSIFSAIYSDADYYFGSLRKWAGFKTGGFAFGKWKKDGQIQPCDGKYFALRTEAMKQKQEYIAGDSDSKEYLKVFEEANEMLNHTEVCEGSEDDIIAAQYFDIDRVKRIRRENAKVLIDTIGCIFELGDNDCPLFVPILTEKRDELRQYLIKHEVYCPVHWPFNNLNNTEISLVCDQRYDTDDMKRICDLILAFREGEKGK